MRDHKVKFFPATRTMPQRAALEKALLDGRWTEQATAMIRKHFADKNRRKSITSN